ncbi:hypothetical protein DID76_04190 [Candidatus Marinamargulisbacteria bacterium SCGC AG-414-C22]|nr:hypothetical protein DID76_04190 [Candidatus Marinamargulisbacteria bacterium SCGC AG-414-C22]
MTQSLLKQSNETIFRSKQFSVLNRLDAAVNKIYLVKNNDFIDLVSQKEIALVKQLELSFFDISFNSTKKICEYKTKTDKSFIFLSDVMATLSMDEFLTLFKQLLRLLIDAERHSFYCPLIFPENVIVNESFSEVFILNFTYDYSTNDPFLYSEVLSDLRLIIKNNLRYGAFYIAPEIIEPNTSIRLKDSRLALYSLGSLLYEYFSQDKLFFNHNVLEVLRYHLSQSIDVLKLDCSDLFKKVIDVLLQKKPSMRYKSFEGLLYDVTDIQQQPSNKHFQLFSKDIQSELIFPNKLYGKDTIIKQFFDFFDVHFKNNNVIFLEGHSGVGKTTYLKALISQLHVDTNFFVYYDDFLKYQDKESYDLVLNLIISLVENEYNILKENHDFISEVHQLIKDNSYLFQLIPNLNQFFLDDNSVDIIDAGALDYDDSLDVVLVNLLTLIFNVIDAVIIIENIEYSPSSFLDTIAFLLHHEPLATFIFTISESVVDESFLEFKKKLIEKEMIDESIIIEDLSIQDINKFLLDSLGGMFPNSLDVSKIIFHKTMGTFSYVKDFISYVCEADILFFSKSKREWDVDFKQLNEVNVSSNLVDVLTKNIDTLPEDTLLILKVAAILGKQFDYSVINELDFGFFCDSHLNIALQRHLVRKIPSFNSLKDWGANILSSQIILYEFLHPKIQHYLLDLVTQDELIMWSFNIVKLYIKRHSAHLLDGSDNIASHLFICYEQIIPQYLTVFDVIKLFAYYARRLLLLKDYHTADSFLKKSLMLFDLYQFEDRVLKLNIFMDLITTSYYLSSALSCKEFFNKALVISENHYEKAEIYLKMIQITNALDKQSIYDLSTQSLALFGFRFSSFFPYTMQLGLEYLKRYCLVFFKSFMFIKKPEQIPVKDEHLILISVNYLLLISEDALLPVIALKLGNFFGRQHNVYKLFDLVLKGFSLTKKADFQGAYDAYYEAFTISSKSKLSNFSDVIEFAAYSFCGPMIFSDTHYLSKIKEIFFRAMQKKNNHLANSTKNLYCFLQLYNGASIYDIKRSFLFQNELISDSIRDFKSSEFLAYNQFIETVLELFVIPSSHNVQQLCAHLVDTVKLTTTIAIHSSILVIACFYSEDYEGMLYVCKKFENQFSTFIIGVSYPMFLFYHVLGLFFSYKITTDQVNQINGTSLLRKQLIKKTLNIFEKNMQGNLNKFQSMFLLLKSITFYFDNQLTLAIKYNLQSISEAKKNSQDLYLALGLEMILFFYYETDDKVNLKRYLVECVTLYDSLGYMVKVTQLKQRYSEVVNFDLIVNDDFVYENVSLSNFLKLNYSFLKSDVSNQLSDIYEIILKVITETVQFDRSVFIVNNEKKLLLEVEYLLSSDELKFYNSMDILDYEKLPHSIIHTVVKNKTLLQIDNVEQNLNYCHLQYITMSGISSVLCIPIILDKDQLFAVIYLERTTTGLPFSDHLMMQLNLLSKQSQTLIENALLQRDNRELIQTLEERVSKQVAQIHTAEEARLKSMQLAEKASNQAAYATLTRGIAHEIRNPMAMILSGTELVMEHLENKDKLIHYLNLVKDSVVRLKSISSNMLRYGNPVSKYKKDVDIVQLLKVVIDVSMGECRKRHINFKFEFQETQCVFVDENSIYQVFLNIILNSIQAIDKDGCILIKTYNCEFYDQTHNLQDGICIEITDDGPGIGKEKLHSIFDPFYSTKYGSSGLGLSIVFNTISHHNGILKVDSVENKFTTFYVYLPLKLDTDLIGKDKKLSLSSME